MGRTVAELIAEPPLDAAEVLVAGDRLRDTDVSWVTVIHWPAAEFARPGELVLTTGVGCDEQELARLVEALSARGVAAVAISIPYDGLVPECVADAARAARLPLLRLPWAVPFADVTRAVLGRLVSRDHAALDGAGGLRERCNRALLAGRSFSGVAEEVERCLGRAAAVFDADLRLVGHGARFKESVGVGSLARLREAGAGTGDGARWDATGEATTMRELIALGAGSETFSLAGTAGHSLGAGWGRRAMARGRALGCVCVLDDRAAPCSAPSEPAAEVMAIAAEAAAIEMLRTHASAESIMLVRSELFRGLLSAPAGEHREARIRGLGIDLAVEYELVLADNGTPTAALEGLRQRVRLRGRGLLECRYEDVTVFAVERDPDGATPLAALVDSTVTQHGDGALHWALGQGARPLAAVHEAYAEARRALRVARCVAPHEAVTDPGRLGAYMVLGSLGDDGYAAQITRALIAPLAAYDAQTGRNLVETLEVFLEEKGNTSSSARRLYLNRHSLMYRLRKIEQLTERSLEDADDRFLLDLSVKLHRFARVDEADSPQPTHEGIEAAQL